jgi:hypothetical protein
MWMDYPIQCDFPDDDEEPRVKKKGRVLQADFLGYTHIYPGGCGAEIQLIRFAGEGKIPDVEKVLIELNYGDFQRTGDNEAILALQIANQCRTVLVDRLQKVFKKTCKARRWRAGGA